MVLILSGDQAANADGKIPFLKRRMHPKEITMSYKICNSQVRLDISQLVTKLT